MITITDAQGNAIAWSSAPDDGLQGQPQVDARMRRRSRPKTPAGKPPNMASAPSRSRSRAPARAAKARFARCRRSASRSPRSATSPRSRTTASARRSAAASDRSARRDTLAEVRTEEVLNLGLAGRRRPTAKEETWPSTQRTGRNSRSPTRSSARPAQRHPPQGASFVAEPLERGFGMTLGNSLRRVLLSSLQGAAVTSIKIEGVLHEFSSLAGVREDVTDIVLNVKQIALKMEGEGPKRLQLSATGPGEVTAGADRRPRRHRGHQPRSRHLPPRRWRDAQHGTDRRHRQGLCPRARPTARPTRRSA